MSAKRRGPCRSLAAASRSSRRRPCRTILRKTPVVLLQRYENCIPQDTTSSKQQSIANSVFQLHRPSWTLFASNSWGKLP